MQDEQRIEHDLAEWRHEVRNRLNIINGYSALLQMEDLSSEQVDFLREIDAAAKSIQSLLDRLRDAGTPVEVRSASEVMLDE